MTERARLTEFLRRMARAHQGKVFRRDGDRCQGCGATDQLTLRHAIPVSVYVDLPEPWRYTRPWNLDTICLSCQADPVEVAA